MSCVIRASTAAHSSRTPNHSSIHPFTPPGAEQTGYQWTDLYYQGDFLSPLSYAGYFAEYFMFQYLSNLTDYAFEALTGSDIQELYGMHVQNMYYGSNIWNSRAMGSQQLGYILASMQVQIPAPDKSQCLLRPSRGLVANNNKLIPPSVHHCSLCIAHHTEFPRRQRGAGR